MYIGMAVLNIRETRAVYMQDDDIQPRETRAVHMQDDDIQPYIRFCYAWYFIVVFLHTHSPCFSNIFIENVFYCCFC